MYGDQSDQYSNRRRPKFDDEYLREQNSFLVWMLDLQWQTADSTPSECALMLQMRDAAGSTNCVNKVLLERQSETEWKAAGQRQSETERQSKIEREAACKSETE